MVPTIKWGNHVWIDCHSEVEEREIKSVESALGVIFPEDFRQCVKQCHGGKPRDNAFAFNDPDIGRMESALGVLLSFSQGTENIVDTYRRLKPHLPEGVIPFADDGGGDFICFQYQGTSDSAPKIVYWHHGEESTVYLCDTFSGFLDMLYDSSKEFRPSE